MVDTANHMAAALELSKAELNHAIAEAEFKSQMSEQLENIIDHLHVIAESLNPNPPKDTDGRREESGRGVRELQGK